jgi:amino acid adenylation domain-containing protein
LTAELRRRKAELLGFLRSTVVHASPSPAIGIIEDRRELPLSCGQQRLWFLTQFQTDSTAYNICFGLELIGALDASALEASLREIVSRHEVLRCRLVNVGGIPGAMPGTSRDWTLERHDFRSVENCDRSQCAARFAQKQSQHTFDLSSGLLLRAWLLQFDEQHHVLMLMLHHIAADGWSLGLLVRELGVLYTAFREGQPSPLPDLPLQYGDFAAWQNLALKSEPMRSQLQYWQKQLQAPLAVVEFPTDRPRPLQPTFRGSRCRMTLPKELADAVHRLCLTEQATTFMVLIGAFKLLLHRYTNLDDIVVGSAVAGRSRPELEGLIGLFINNLTLRTSLAGDPTVRQLIARVRETSLNAFANQEIPFDQVVAAVQPDRNLSRSPLFQVMFILQNFPIRTFSLPALSVQPLHIDAGTSRFDLTIEANENEQGAIDLYFEYNTDLFDRSTIDRLSRHYEHLLAGMTLGPDRRISELSLFSAAELNELQAASHQTRADYPREALIHDLLESQAARTPDKVAVVCGPAQISYAELSRRSNQLANLLRTLGVGPDVLVGICLKRSIDMVVAVLGVLKAGGAYVPMDPHFPGERLAYMARDAAVRVMLTDEASRHIVTVPDAAVLSLDADRDQIGRQSERLPEAISSAENLAYVIYTSGSTGMPKGVQITHRAVVNFLESMRREPGLTSDDCLLSVTTLSFDIAGLEIYLPLMVGARIVLAPRPVASDGRALARLLTDAGVTVMQATPATWRMLFDSGWKGQNGLRVWCGGEALTRELANRLLAGCAELWNLYGPTETTIWSTACRVTAGVDVVPIGKPIANTQVYILDEHRRPVPPGVPGELYIGGDGLARGYLNREELTTEKFVPDPFSPGERLYRTGDLARSLPDGVLQCLGRLDHQVKIRGFRVELGEIECALERCDGVSNAVVVLREDEPGDQRLVGYVIPHTGASISPQELRSNLLATLPDYMVPSAFVMLAEFPLTPNRKVDRRALPAPGVYSAPVAHRVPATTEAERGIAAIWKELLRRDGVGIHDNFFDLGGHSLLLVQLQSRLRSRFGREIPMIELFQKPTISSMAGFFASPAVDGVRFVADGYPERSGTVHA